MRKRTLGVVLLAGLAISGGGAFTASNDVTAINGGTKNIAGYGQATVTGAVVTAVNYTTMTSDASKLASVKFRSSDDLTGKKAQVTLKDGSGVQMGNPYTCTVTFYAVSTTNLAAYSEGVCDTSAAAPEIAAIGTTGITVNN